MIEDIITLSNTLGALLGVVVGTLGPLLGVVVGSFITYYFSRKLANDNVRKKSNRRLRESLSGEQAYMEDPDRKRDPYQNHIHPRLLNALEKQHKTVIEHMHHLNDDKKRALQIAWDKYKFGVHCHEYEFRGTKGNVPKVIFKERIAAILKFAAD